MRSKKIIKSLIKSGLDPFKVGRENFKNPNAEVEELAKERFYNHCLNCDELQDETVDLYKIHDWRIPEASEKYCGDCGCILSFKIRQSVEPCKKWKR